MEAVSDLTTCLSRHRAVPLCYFEGVDRPFFPKHSSKGDLVVSVAAVRALEGADHELAEVRDLGQEHAGLALERERERGVVGGWGGGLRLRSSHVGERKEKRKKQASGAAFNFAFRVSFSL